VRLSNYSKQPARFETRIFVIIGPKPSSYHGIVNFLDASEPAPHLSTIRAIIFDYGDVISLPADPDVIRWMAKLFGLTEDRFRQIYGTYRHEYDRGSYSATQYWQHIAHAAGREVSADQIAELRRLDVAMWARLNPDILVWAERLQAAGYKTAILSNMHDDMVQHLRSNGDWTKRFDSMTLSSAIGTAKPEPEIFEHCLKSLGVRADEALFIDDREANIEGALRAGISGIFAPSPEELRATLSAIGFTPLP
jgi:putative hydrolase of the HAD superfamily